MSIDHRQKLAIWLYISAFMVFAMAVIGAVTRLTESGLSIVEWKPLIGALPPLNDTQWQRVFTLYQETPEYQLKNAGMSLPQFQAIFFWEWFHRLWGRAIGLVFALPLIFFWIRGMIPQGWKAPLFGVLILGGCQGVLGWYMVASGLIDRPSVSHFRLAAHLSLAAVIFAILIGMAQKIGSQRPLHITILGALTFIMVTTTLIWGAFVAGLDAGMIYNQFPHMGQGRIVPEEFLTAPHSWQWMIFNDPVGVQFIHRWIAITTVCITVFYAWRRQYWPLGGMVLLQMILGIGTLIMQVPIPMAAAHQAGAFITLALVVRSMDLSVHSRMNAARTKAE